MMISLLILAFSVLAMVAMVVALVLAFGNESVGGVAEFSSKPDHSYSDDIEWAIGAAQAYSRNGQYGSVSLREEGEAWRSTLCHGPGECSS
jgi:hypothetical protein